MSKSSPSGCEKGAATHRNERDREGGKDTAAQVSPYRLLLLLQQCGMRCWFSSAAVTRAVCKLLAELGGSSPIVSLAHFVFAVTLVVVNLRTNNKITLFTIPFSFMLSYLAEVARETSLHTPASIVRTPCTVGARPGRLTNYRAVPMLMKMVSPFTVPQPLVRGQSYLHVLHTRGTSVSVPTF